MLPDCRAAETFSIPKFDLVKEDVEGLIDELKAYQSQFHDCFLRSESREHFFHYTVGQLSHFERKSIEPIALKVSGANVRPMQRFVSDTVWQNERIEARHRGLVQDDMGEENGVMIVDESSFVKKGNDSAGVSRQYCGSIGKVENSQVGVFAAYASRHGYAMVDKSLYVSEKWFEKDYDERRKKCRFPEELSFKTKPRLAAEMLAKLREENILQFRYVTADSIYGENDDFISEVEKHVGLTYFVSVGCDTLFWLRMPVTVKKTYKSGGEIRQKTALRDAANKPLKAKEFAENLNNSFWYRRKVSEGTKGPIEYEFTRRRVVLSKDGLPRKTVWLIIKRNLGEKKEYSFFLSNAPVSSRLKLFVWLSGMRWPIEQCFEEMKTELGFAQYEVRKFTGWHNHVLLTMLAHFFLWHTKIRLGKKSSVSYRVSS